MKKFLTSAGTVSAGLVMLATSFAFAQTSTTPNATTTTPPAPKQEMVLQVGPKGNAMLRGTVANVGNGSLTVNSWGGTWTVNVGPGAQVLPMATGAALAQVPPLSQFKSVDYVGVEGMVSTSGAWTIDAKLVRDWSLAATMKQEEQQNNEAIRAAHGAAARNFIGTASAVNGTSFTLTAKGGTVYTVNVAANAAVMNRNRATMSVSGIQNGDNVRVWGTNASGTISASVVRDMSLPVRPAGTNASGTNAGR